MSIDHTSEEEFRGKKSTIKLISEEKRDYLAQKKLEERKKIKFVKKFTSLPPEEQAVIIFDIIDRLEKLEEKNERFPIRPY